MEALGSTPTLKGFSVAATVPELEILLQQLGIIARREQKPERELRELALNCLNLVRFANADPDVVKCFMAHFEGLGEAPTGNPTAEQRQLVQHRWDVLEKRGEPTNFLRKLFSLVCKEAALVAAA